MFTKTKKKIADHKVQIIAGIAIVAIVGHAKRYIYVHPNVNLEMVREAAFITKGIGRQLTKPSLDQEGMTALADGLMEVAETLRNLKPPS